MNLTQNNTVRGVYTSGRKGNESISKDYDMIEEYVHPIYPANTAFYDSKANLKLLDLESNYEKDDQESDFYNESAKDTADCDSAKLNKPEEDETVYINDSINDISLYSTDSVTNSTRKIHKENDLEDVYGFKGATQGKKIDLRSWNKDKSQNSFLRGFKRFFATPTYPWGWADDFTFKWCENAAKWIIQSEGAKREKINPFYYEDEFNRLFEEVHSRISLNHSASDNTLKQIENRRIKIEQNKVQIIKDLDRTFIGSKVFGENTKGRLQLMNTLEVISLKYTGIGYVQGMNFVVAGILFHASPAVTLGLMSHLIENVQLCDVYAENLVGVHYHNQNLLVLFRKHLPKLSWHLKKFDVNLEIFTTQWIIDLFSHLIPLEQYKLFLDSFFQKGFEFFYRLVLSVLNQISPDILKLREWSEVLEGIKEKMAYINWKKAISYAEYNYHKLF